MTDTVRFDLGDVVLSGLSAGPASSPRATILALHGGGYSAAYWDHPIDPSSSLLTLGAQLGHRVIAIDRPGYGASHGVVGDDVRVDRQVEVLWRLIDHLASQGDVGKGVFLIGHSMGAIVAIRMAASPRGSELLGIEFSGLPIEFSAPVGDAETLAAIDHLPDSTWEFRRELFYGPDGTFDPAIAGEDERMSRPVPASEIIDAVNCPVDTATYAARVRVPVQYTLAEFEASSVGGKSNLERGASLFTASPRVVTNWQVGTAHNISLHHVARSYHLRALAFLEETLITRPHPV